MLIAGFQKSTLLDYPGKVAAMVFTYSCNLRCEYCHNPELVTLPCPIQQLFSVEHILDFLKNRRGLLDALVITGGEPTLHADLESFISKVKDLGYLIKLDTNGTNPHVVKNLLERDLVDYWAMDIKYPEEIYTQELQPSIDPNTIKESISLIMNSKKAYEFRTTYVKGIHDINSAKQIGELIKGADNYYIQNFRPGKTINTELSYNNSFSPEELLEIKGAITPFVKTVTIRE